MSDVEALIEEANSWRNEDPSADSTEQVSEEVTSLIARLADALEFVTDNYVLKAWSGLFEILDEGYPEDVFLALPDNESRDSGLRIISLIRLLDRERTRAQVAESRLVSAPISDERETLHNAIRETVIAWEEYGGNIERMLKESLSGFRLPVVPVPVYEYGLLDPEKSTKNILTRGAHLISDNRKHIETQHRRGHPAIQFVRRTKAGEWEPVEATRKEQP